MRVPLPTMQMPSGIAVTQQPKTIDGVIPGVGKKSVLRVYLVEDCAMVCDSLLVLLHIPGEVEIIGHADGETESVSAIVVDPVNAVIVDLNLREGTGMGVLERLQRATLTPRPKVIVFTNHVAAEIKLRAFQLGADYFLDKSADYDELRAILQALRIN